MRKNPQNSPFSPDKLGHWGLHAAFASMLFWLLPKIQPYPWDIIWTVFLTLILAIGIEVWESLRWHKGNFGEWLLLLDTAYDFVWDLLGLICSLLTNLLHSYPYFILAYAFIGYFFGRFTNWRDFKKRWWDLNPFHFSI